MLPRCPRTRTLLTRHRPFSLSHIPSAGHNKWSKIKQKKGINDALRSSVYSKAFRDIVLAVRTGGSGDPEINTPLAVTIKKYKALGVPKDNIENALAKATGEKDTGSQPATYEAIAYGTVGMIIECLTDNANRTHHNLREILTEHNARLKPVGFMFQRKGYVRVSIPADTEERDRMESLLDCAAEAGADEFDPVVRTSEVIEVEMSCAPENLRNLTDAVSQPGISRELLASELVYTPKDEKGEGGPDEETRSKLADLVEALEENEDCLKVWTTLES